VAPPPKKRKARENKKKKKTSSKTGYLKAPLQFVCLLDLPHSKDMQPFFLKFKTTLQTN